uniref:Uncharacterized protein n=1 Tax=Solanum lycopersicum TaxID=4081 RepID=K4D7B2_SOLLC
MRGSAQLPNHGISKITLKVVVFHLRLSAPTYTTPLKSFDKVGLESSSKGSSFPPDSAKPALVDRHRGNLVNPFMQHWAEITLRKHPLGPSQCFVLIKQWDSPCPSPIRHAATRSRRGSSSSSPTTGLGLGSTCPSLRANPFPEVMDPLCTLPFPTLFHRLEVVHLGDLMRLRVRPSMDDIRSPDFQGPPRAHRTPRDVRCSSSSWTLPLAKPIPRWAGC